MGRAEVKVELVEKVRSRLRGIRNWYFHHFDSDAEYSGCRRWVVWVKLIVVVVVVVRGLSKQSLLLLELLL